MVQPRGRIWPHWTRVSPTRSPGCAARGSRMRALSTALSGTDRGFAVGRAPAAGQGSVRGAGVLCAPPGWDATRNLCADQRSRRRAHAPAGGQLRACGPHRRTVAGSVTAWEARGTGHSCRSGAVAQEARHSSGQSRWWCHGAVQVQRGRCVAADQPDADALPRRIRSVGIDGPYPCLGACRADRRLRQPQAVVLVGPSSSAGSTAAGECAFRRR